MTYKYGSMLPYKTLSIWNGIGCGHGGDRIGGCPRQQADLADRKPLAQLQKTRCRKDVLAGLALAQKIDVEICRHRKADRADRRQQHYIHGEVSQRHQRRSRDRPARTKHLVAVALTEQARSPVGAFDGDIAATEDLGIFGIEKLLQLDRVHFRNCHVARLFWIQSSLARTR